MAVITMRYGTYNFSPVPLMSISRGFNKNAVGIFGVTFDINLNGTLLPPSTGEGYGLQKVIALQNLLRSGFNTEGREFVVACDDSTLISGYPRIGNVEFKETPGQWVTRSDFSISLQLDEELVYNAETSGIHGLFSEVGYISEHKEEWDLEFADDHAYYSMTTASGFEASPYQVRLTHRVEAVGKDHFGPSGYGYIPAWQQARKHVIHHLGYNSSILLTSGVFNLPYDQFTPYNHIRTQHQDENNGTFAVTESWLVINPSGTGVLGHAIEDFSINSKKSIDSDIISFTIEGSIQGLENRTYGSFPSGFSIIESKFSSASGYWNVVRNRLLPRVNVIANTLGLNKTVNINPLNWSVGYSPTKGTISYNYDYDNRPSNYVANAISEQITITDNNPTDVFASLVVLGRSYGPVLQSIGTVTEASRAINIEVVLPITGGTSITDLLVPTDSKAQVDALVNVFYQGLLDADNLQIYNNVNNESWNPKTGKYSRNMGWVYQGGF